MYIFRYLSILIAFSLLMTVPLIGAEFKIGVVDEQKVIDEYKKSITLIKLLEKNFRKEESSMKKLEKKIIETKRELMIAGRSKKEKLLGQMRRMEIEYKVNKEYLTEMLSIQRNNYTLEVLKDIDEAIKMYSKEKNFNLILRKSLPGTRGEGIQKMVFYNSPEMNITNDILSLLNLKYKQTK